MWKRHEMENLQEIVAFLPVSDQDNKIMSNTAALSDRPLPQAVVLNVTERDSASTQKTSIYRRFRARFRLLHLVDVCIFTVVVLVMLLVELGYVPNTKLGFICKDPKISYPFRGDTVSGTTLMVSAFFGPLFFIILIEALRERAIKRVCVGTVWDYYKECLIGASLVLLITEVIKVIVGEQRPHFFDSCEPDANRYCQPGQFILDYNCTNTRLSGYFKTDITRSFPSGHTSISLFVALYLSYLVHVRIHSETVSKLTKPFLMSVCLSWSLLCSLTRITDRRHHWWDVLGGAFLAICGAAYIVVILHSREKANVELIRTNTSTTTLLDVKNKDATSVII